MVANLSSKLRSPLDSETHANCILLRILVQSRKMLPLWALPLRKPERRGDWWLEEVYNFDCWTHDAPCFCLVLLLFGFASAWFCFCLVLLVFGFASPLRG